MSKGKRQSKKKLVGKVRTKDAARWLEGGGASDKPLVQAYSNRYGVPEQTARTELMAIGYHNDICIEDYESEGVEWMYRVDGRSGDMFVVPKDSEEHEMYEIHGML